MENGRILDTHLFERLFWFWTTVYIYILQYFILSIRPKIWIAKCDNCDMLKYEIYFGTRFLMYYADDILYVNEIVLQLHTMNTMYFVSIWPQ